MKIQQTLVHSVGYEYLNKDVGKLGRYQVVCNVQSKLMKISFHQIKDELSGVFDMGSSCLDITVLIYKVEETMQVADIIDDSPSKEIEVLIPLTSDGKVGMANEDITRVMNVILLDSKKILGFLINYLNCLIMKMLLSLHIQKLLLMRLRCS